MANLADITRRAAFTTQALGAMGGSPEWDAALTRYLLTDALQNADAEYGDFYQADQQHEVALILLEEKYGKGFRSNPEAAEIYGALNERFDTAEARREKQFLHPFWEAGRALATTPAPTLAAVLFKFALMDAEELGNDGTFDGDCAAIVAADIAALNVDIA